MRILGGSQSGFGRIVLLGVIGLFAAVSLATAEWAVYDHNRPRSTDAAASSQLTSQPNAEKSTSLAENKQGSSGKNVVTISGLGVDLTVPANIKDLTYTVSTVTLRNGNQATLAMFSTKSLTALDPNCGSSFGPLGSLEKAAGTYPTQSQDESNVLDYGQLVKQLPTYYVSTASSQGSCSTKAAVQNTASKFAQAFKDSLSTISSTQS